MTTKQNNNDYLCFWYRSVNHFSYSMDLNQKELNSSMRAQGRLLVFGNKSRGARGCVQARKGAMAACASKGQALPNHASRAAGRAEAPALADEPEHFLNRHQAARAEAPALAFRAVRARAPGTRPERRGARSARREHLKGDLDF